jgi:three-Cys-motif partner protein
MSKEDFFEEQLPCSKIKTSIVTSYFNGWSKIMLKWSDTIGYVDLFAGPGKYEDGADSTPLIIIKSAIANKDLSSSLVTIFNDKGKINIEKLKFEISSLPGIKSLKHEPLIDNAIVGDDIVNKLKEIEMMPSLIFIDPWGYKGLSLDLIASVIKDWGCDCIFFFNYNRINAAITNPAMVKNVDSIFGKEVAEDLRKQVPKLIAQKREKLILKTFMNELKSIKGQFSIKYKFYQEDGSKTSHFLIFVTKNVLGYHLMKEIMAKNCGDIDGIPTYEFSPVEKSISKQHSLFDGLEGTMFDLIEDLQQSFKGKNLTMDEIYKNHNVNKPCIKSNYKNALLKLESENKIIVDPIKSKRRVINGKLTMGDKVSITFK